MLFPMKTLLRSVVTGLFLISLYCHSAQGFIIDPNLVPWLSTASGTRTGNGDAVTFTWSIVPDGSTISDTDLGISGTSDLISTLDATFGAGPGGTDLSQRPWFEIFEDSFERWGSVSGAAYVYEPADDGQAINGSTSVFFEGVLGSRGDLRIGGTSIDGSNSVLAYNYFPDSGDMVLDTDDTSFFSDPFNSFRAMRNVIMHEHGHGIGLEHVVSSTDQLLLEPVIDTSFDGPQLDDIRGIQYFFGDAYEKTNGGLGNDTALLASDLGTLQFDQGLSVGSDANVATQEISADATDFVSLANINDTDFYSFSIDDPGLLTAALTPLGGSFSQSGEGGSPTTFNASARVDLALTIFDTDGTTVLQTADVNGLGGIETIASLTLPTSGDYFARISGANDTVQLYELQLSLSNFLEADFNMDGTVDELDLLVWQSAYRTDTGGDANDDGNTDGADFLTWQRQLGLGVTSSLAATASVPEPSSVLLISSALWICAHGRYRRSKSSDQTEWTSH